MSNKKSALSVETEDGTRLQFDCLVVATGVHHWHMPVKEFKEATNVFYLESEKDHKKLVQNLGKIKKLTVLGCSMNTL